MIDKNSNSVVLDVFFDNPTKEFHARGLSRKTGLSIFSVLEAIKRLSKEDLVSVSKKGNMKIVKASNSVDFIRKKRVRNLEKIYNSGLVDYLNETYDKPSAIILFGSFGRGDDIENSDIDIAVITKEHKDNKNNLGKFEKILSRKISLEELDLPSKMSDWTGNNMKNNLRGRTTREFFINLINGIVLEGAL